jgi:hypothetical protein
MLASVTWAATPPAGCSGNCTAAFTSPNPTTTGSNNVTLPAAGIWNISATVTSTLSATANVPAASVQATAAQTQQGPNDCGSSFAHTRTLSMPAWVVGAAPHVHIYTADAGHLGPKDAVVVEITTPAQLGTDKFGNISWSDIGADPPAQRVLVLSDIACDFTTGLNAAARVANVNNGSLWFTAGPNSYGYPALTIPNHKYYLNIKNAAGACSSSTGHCDLDLEFTIPN